MYLSTVAILYQITKIGFVCTKRYYHSNRLAVPLTSANTYLGQKFSLIGFQATYEINKVITQGEKTSLVHTFPKCCLFRQYFNYFTYFTFALIMRFHIFAALTRLASDLREARRD